MATMYADPDVYGYPLLARSVDERRVQHALRLISTAGWQERLQPLALHMGERRLVCARGYAGARLHRLNLEVLRSALSNLLRERDDDGHLVYQLLIAGMEPAAVAAERGVSQATLVDLLRDAVDALAVEYEDTAFPSVGESEQEQARTALAHKRR